jgi:integrase
MTHDVYLRLLEVADRVHPLLTLALVVAEGTGRRISAWENLRWDDVDFAAGTIRWRAKHDKKGYQEGIRTGRPDERRGEGGVLDNWLRRCFLLAGVELEKSGLWHTLRCKWATERKGYPVKDVAAAGGWQDVETLLKSYLQPDPDTVRRIVLHRRSGWRVGEARTG